MLYDYMRKRNPGKPVSNKESEPQDPPTEYTSNPNVSYRDSAREQVHTWWLPRTLRFIADCLEAE